MNVRIWQLPAIPLLIGGIYIALLVITSLVVIVALIPEAFVILTALILTYLAARLFIWTNKNYSPSPNLPHRTPRISTSPWGERPKINPLRERVCTL
jgi:hypothetical protein